MRWRARSVVVGAVIVLGFAGGLPAAAQAPDDLLNDQSVQRIDVYLHSRDWARLKANFELNTHYPADVWWRGQAARNAGIRSRGGWSRSGTKPGLLIEFGRYVSGQTLSGLDSLVLKNLRTDASAVRDFLAMKLMRRLGVPAPRVTFASVYVNNTFMGLYGAVENISRAALPRLFGEDSGYLFKFDWTDYPAQVIPYYFPYVGPDPSAYAAFFKPQTRQMESPSQLYGPIEAWARTVQDAPDSEFVEAVSQYLDVKGFIRHVAGQAYLAELDGLLGGWGMNNFFLYRSAGTTVHRFVAWDEDSAFWSTDYPLVSGHEENPIMRRLMQSAEIRRAYFADVLEAAALADQADETAARPAQPGAGSGPGWLEQEAMTVLDLIRPALYADTKRPFTIDEFELDAARVLAFTRVRGTIVRCAAAGLTGQALSPACSTAPVGMLAR